MPVAAMPVVAMPVVAMPVAVHGGQARPLNGLTLRRCSAADP